MPLSTRPVAVCLYGVQYTSFIFSLSDLNLVPVKAVPLSVLIVFGLLFSKIYCSKKVFADFPVGALQIHAAGHLLYRSMENNIKNLRCMNFIDR